MRSIHATSLVFLALMALSCANVIKPERLVRGDTIGFISPSSQVKNSFPDIEQYKKYITMAMEQLGFKVKFGTYAFRDGYGGLAGNDKERAHDLMDMFRDPTVKAIIANRGGWGCNRILNMLDYGVIKSNPKIFMGYSDLTGCTTAIQEKTGLVTFHGPMGVNNWSNLNRPYMLSVLANGHRVTFENPSHYNITTIRHGVARGKLIGGNLSVFNALIEDVSEAPYKVDRLMTTLALHGVFDKASGLIFGTCASCTNSGDTFTIQEILIQKWGHLNIPSYTGAMIGHISEQFTLPLGTQVEMDASRGTIQMLESAVL